MCRQYFAMWLILIVASSTGCVSSHFQNPPFDLSKATFPDNLEGVYRSENLFVHIGKAGSIQPKGAVRVLQIDPVSADQGLHSTGLLAFTTKIDSDYLAVVPLPKNATKDSSKEFSTLWTESFKEENVGIYWIFRVSLKKSKLTIMLPDGAYLARAIETGELAGEVSRSSNPDLDIPPTITDVSVTSSQADLEKFVKAHFDKGLFKPAEGSYRKL